MHCRRPTIVPDSGTALAFVIRSRMPPSLMKSCSRRGSACPEESSPGGSGRWHVRYHFCRASFDKGPVRLKGLLGVFAEVSHEQASLDRLSHNFKSHAQEVLVIDQKLFEAGAATFVSLISVSFDVPDALLPSAMFCLPERAACTIWSLVRSPLLRYRWQKRNVMS